MQYAIDSDSRFIDDNIVNRKKYNVQNITIQYV